MTAITTKHAAILLAFLTLTGCNTIFPDRAASDAPVIPSLQARYAATPVHVDGILDDPVWQHAVTYPLGFSLDRTNPVTDSGSVQLAWDDNYFYVAAHFNDTDIVAEGLTDQLHHYRMGDVCELFLKPENEKWYWELYATPANRKTTFWFPSRGCLGLPSTFENYTSGLTVAAQVDGTLNDWQSKDNAWTVEMAMPIEDLTARGETFGPGAAWRILVARYNYSAHLEDKELTTAPQLPATNFHNYENYARLIFTHAP